MLSLPLAFALLFVTIVPVAYTTASPSRSELFPVCGSAQSIEEVRWCACSSERGRGTVCTGDVRTHSFARDR
jgi:hypothetical protein